MLWMNCTPYVISKNYKTIETLKNAVCLGSWCVKNRQGGWVNFPVDVYYQFSKTNPEYSDYFAVYQDQYSGGVMITSGETCFSEILTGIIDPETNEVLVSRYRHDYVKSANGQTAIDGGRDYTKIVGGGEIIQIRVEGENFIEVSTGRKITKIFHEMEKV